MPARPVGISVSAGAKPGAGAAPHPSNTEGSRERLLHVPPSLPRARKFFFPPHCPGEAQQVQGEGRRIRSPSHCLPSPNPREFSKRSVSQESLSPQAPAPRIRPCPPLSPGRTQPPTSPQPSSTIRPSATDPRASESRHLAAHWGRSCSQPATSDPDSGCGTEVERIRGHGSQGNSSRQHQGSRAGEEG